MTEYIVADRSSGIGNWSIQVEDGQLKYTSTVSSAQSEPIFQDTENSSNYWKLFIEDEQLAIESTITEQNDYLVLEDIITATKYRFFVSDGQFNYNSVFGVTISVNVLTVAISLNNIILSANSLIDSLLSLSILSSLSSVNVIADALFNSSSLELQSSLNSIEISSNASVDLSNLELVSSLNNISILGSSTIDLSALNIISNLNNVIISSDSILDSSILTLVSELETPTITAGEENATISVSALTLSLSQLVSTVSITSQVTSEVAAVGHRAKKKRKVKYELNLIFEIVGRKQFILDKIYGIVGLVKNTLYISKNINGRCGYRLYKKYDVSSKIKSFLRDEISIAGKLKTSYHKFDVFLEGVRKLDFECSNDIEGIRKIVFDRNTESYFNIEFALYGQKIINFNEIKNIAGKIDNSNLLVALELV